MNEYTMKNKLKEPLSENHLIIKPKYVQVKESKSAMNYTESITQNFDLEKCSEDFTNNPFDLPQYERVFSRTRKVKQPKPDPFIMSDPITICDLDSNFYKIVEGRPLRQFIDIQVYMSNIRDITLFRANAAYLKEQIIQIDASAVHELQRYNKIHKLYIKTKENFIQFIKQQYSAAKCMQEQAERKVEDLRDMIEQLNALSFTYVKLRNEVDSLIVIFEMLSKYGHFLNSLTPYWWRIIFDKDFEDNNLLFAQIFANMEAPSVSLRNLYKTSIHLLKKTPPKIYFKKPIQLIRIFDNMSKQSLNYMQIENYSSNILKPVLSCCNKLKKKVLAEVNEVKEFIAFYEEETKWMEDKEVAYKSKFYKILFNEFQNLYSSFESSHLYTCVQYVHTKLFGGPEDPKDDITTMTYNIENLYLKLTSKFDNLNQNLINEVTRQLFADDIKNMNRAYKAQRSLRECRILKKALISSFEPPKSKRKEIVTRK